MFLCRTAVAFIPHCGIKGFECHDNEGLSVRTMREREERENRNREIEKGERDRKMR